MAVACAAYAWTASVPAAAASAPPAAGPAAGAARTVAEPASALSWLGTLADMQQDLGRLAEQRGSTAAVRRYGRVLTGDGGIELTYLEHVAARSGFRIEAQAPNALSSTIASELGGLRGVEFDQAFLRFVRIVAAHTLAVLVQIAPTTSSDALRAAANSMRPMVEQHLRLAVLLQPSPK